MTSNLALGAKTSRLHWSILLVIGWLCVVGLAEWFYAIAETEPPEWDVLNYAAKGLYFWDAIGHGKLLGLFDVEPTNRPPGTVLMSYPFGFSKAYGPFYFRSVFFPLCLVVCGVYIVAYFRE